MDQPGENHINRYRVNLINLPLKMSATLIPILISMFFQMHSVLLKSTVNLKYQDIYL